MSGVAGGNFSHESMRFVRLQRRPRSRFMPHNGARERQWLDRTWVPGAAAEGVMVRRPSVASLDSGAESPVYGAEPSVSADRMGTVARLPWADGGGRQAVRSARAVLGAPALVIGYRGVRALTLDETPGGAGAGGDAATFAPGLPGGVRRGFRHAPRRGHLAPGRAGRSDTRHAGCGELDASRAGQRGGVADLRKSRHVGRRSAAPTMIFKGHPCIHAAGGDPMTRYASSWAVPYGWRPPRKRTDVHGREG